MSGTQVDPISEPLEARAGEWARLLEDVAMVERGHFLLSSGLHSPVYVQVARLLQHPHLATRALAAMAGPFRDRDVQVVAGPAVGAVVIAYDVARYLGARAVWTERVDGRMALRRSFAVAPGERALVVEDVITTGGSVGEVKDVLEAAGAEVVGIAALINRFGQGRLSGTPIEALVRLDLPTYPAGACPMCTEGAPLTKPGSRSG